MQNIFSIITTIWFELFLWLVGMGALFTLLAKITPCNREQKFFRSDAITDIIYCFLLPVINRLMRIAFVGGGIFIIFRGSSQETLQEYMLHGYGYLATIPLWVQAVFVFLASDVLLYFIHRVFHGRKLWPFHAIHHSSPQLDWLSTFRFHPINTWLSTTLVDSLMLIIGFSPAAVGLFANFNLLYSAMVHANLNWTFGPFKYIFASPVFHRWHHTSQEEGMDKNFAPTFPILDVIFGTFYMPENKSPAQYGVPGSDIPQGFIGQLIWPFKQKKN